MSTEISPISPKIYTCNYCNITCNKKSEWTRHISTRKHKFNENGEIINENGEIINDFYTQLYECNCGKTYKERSGLWRHKKLCTNNLEKNEIDNENIIIQDASANEIKVLTSLVLELVKSNNDLQKQMIDVCKNIKPSSSITSTNSTINSHNKTFNLQFFLNEQCKDAMNIKDFVKSIKIEMSDLERIGKEGYVEGISRIILEKLKNTDIYKRPLHCSDAKRETMYIKENDVWNKDESLNNEKMIQFIKDVDNKNYDFLLKYAQEYPEVYQHDSKKNTPYLHMVLQSTRDAERVNKVIKRIIKEVVINKENN